MAKVPFIPAKKKPKESPVEAAIRRLKEQSQTAIVHPSQLPLVSQHLNRGALNVGRPLPTTYIPPDRVQSAVAMSTLERQLEDSLWALNVGWRTAVPAEVREHLPHLAGSTERIRRVQADSVDILCTCHWVLRFLRCTQETPHNGRCGEEVPVVEGGHALCVLHR